MQRFWLLVTSLVAVLAAEAAPYVPVSDAQVVERLALRAGDPIARQTAVLRARLARDPRDLDTAVRLARLYFERVGDDGDPRYVGYAQAVLGPWWEQADPPPSVRVLRAMLRQFAHQFDAATADLEAVVRHDPGHVEAWSWLAALAMVQARYDDARLACARMAGGVSTLIETACRAFADSLSGQAGAASAALRSALAAAAAAPAAERLWAHTRLAEIEERRGDFVAAEAHYRQALALGLPDAYLHAAYADFLLDRGRPDEVLELLKDRQRSDALLLRIALAARAAGSPSAPRWAQQLAARFDAARQRGPSLHEKEEARFALVMLGRADRAVELARSNFAVQREPADARILLEAALAARQPEAAGPALQWMERHQVESVALRALARQLQASR